MKFAGIPLRLHWTFSLMVLLIFILSWEGGFSWVLFTWNSLFIGSLFVCVILHEYGHALTARRYGITTRDIILTPIGGIARLEGMPSNPRHELVIAVAGPLVNIAIAGLLLFPTSYFFSPELNELKQVFLSGTLEVEDELSVILRYWMPALFLLNVVLATFNLLPAFPMDGGRILRALLAMRWGRLRATRLASRIGQGAGLLFVLIGYHSSHPGLIFIGIFIAFVATKEYKELYQYEHLRRQSIADIIQPVVFHLSVNDSPLKARAFLRQVQRKSLPVFDEQGTAIGQLSLKQLKILPEGEEAQKATIRPYLRPWPTRLFPEDSLLTALQKLHYSRSPWLPVFDGAVLIGVLSKGKIMEWLKNQKG